VVERETGEAVVQKELPRMAGGVEQGRSSSSSLGSVARRVRPPYLRPRAKKSTSVRVLIPTSIADTFSCDARWLVKQKGARQIIGVPRKKSKRRKAMSEKQRARDEKVRELLRDADLKKFDEELFEETQSRKRPR
jgi:hypothetical protein